MARTSIRTQRKNASQARALDREAAHQDNTGTDTIAVPKMDSLEGILSLQDIIESAGLSQIPENDELGDLPPLPVLTRSDTRLYLGLGPEEEAKLIADINLDLLPDPPIDTPEAPDAPHNATILAHLINRTACTKPKKPKRVRTPDADSKPPAKRSRKKAVPPVWMLKSASIDDLCGVLRIQPDTEMIYIDVPDASTPGYDEYTTTMVRSFIRAARKHPSICSEWGKIALCKDEEYISIPLNGRNASRGDGMSKARAFEALDAFKKLGCKNVQVSALKDLGFGSTKAREFKQEWDTLQVAGEEE